MGYELSTTAGPVLADGLLVFSGLHSPQNDKAVLYASDRWQEVVDLMDKAIAANGDDYNLYIVFINVLGSLGRPG